MKMDEQTKTTLQSIIYDVVNWAGGRIVGNMMTPNVAMAIAIYVTPQVTHIADRAILDAELAIYQLQLYFFLNRTSIYYTFEKTSNINVFDSGYILNLNIGNSTDSQAPGYRESLASAIEDRLVIFNMIDTSVCILVPFRKKPLTGRLGTNIKSEGFSLVVAINSCVVQDLVRNLVYTFEYVNGGLNQIVYFDGKNGWHMTCGLNHAPIIARI
jgi:hypothetical protein